MVLVFLFQRVVSLKVVGSQFLLEFLMVLGFLKVLEFQFML